MLCAIFGSLYVRMAHINKTFTRERSICRANDEDGRGHAHAVALFANYVVGNYRLDGSPISSLKNSNNIHAVKTIIMTTITNAR
jgi:hypothetical protein